MLDMGNPFTDDQGIGALQIPAEMVIICRGKLVYSISAESQLFSQMEYGPEHIREPLMFQEVGVFQKLKEKVALLEKEFLEILKGRLIDLDVIGKLAGC